MTIKKKPIFKHIQLYTRIPSVNTPILLLTIELSSIIKSYKMSFGVPSWKSFCSKFPKCQCLLDSSNLIERGAMYYLSTSCTACPKTNTPGISCLDLFFPLFLILNNGLNIQLNAHNKYGAILSSSLLIYKE